MFANLWNDLRIILFAALIVIGIFAGKGMVIGFGVMGFLVLGIGWMWNRISLEEVSYHRNVSPQRVFMGEEVSLSLTLTNKKPVPLARVKVEDELPEDFEISDAEVTSSASPRSQILHHKTSMAWYEKISWEYRLKCFRRGLYNIGPVRIASGDLFGFFEREVTSHHRDYLLVYPKVVPLPELGLPAARPLGEIGGGIAMFQDPSRPLGIRDYEQGDPLNTVDWKASARRQTLQVRTFEPSSTMTVILAVVVETTARYWEGYSAVNLERVITAAASVARYAAEKRYSLGLFSDGTPILADRPMRVSPSRSPEQETIILEALATIRPLPMGSMGPLLTEYSRRFPMGATLVVITALVLPELVEAISNLKGRGYRIVVLYLGDEQCPDLPDGVLVHELQDHFAAMELAGEFGPR